MSIGSLRCKYYIWCVTAHLFPIPCPMTSHWQLEISHGGWEYLHQRIWFTLQIRALFIASSSIKPVVKHSWASHYLALTGLRSQTCDQLEVLIPNGMDVGRGLQNLPKALPVPLQSHFAGITSDAFQSLLLCPPPTTKTPMPVPNTHSHSQHILLGVILLTATKFWGMRVCGPGAGGWGLKGRSSSSGVFWI